MKAAPFELARPRTVHEACELLAQAGDAAQVIAGGQSLMPLLALRMSQPLLVVDLGLIEELRGVSRQDGSIRVGAMTRQNDVIADPLLNSELPTLVTAARQVGHFQTRNRGTIGGSIALGEPAAEMPATAVALGATIHVASVGGNRRIRADEFYLGPYATALEPGEILTGIDYPDWPGHSIIVFREVAQRPGDFALVGLVGSLVLDQGLIVRAGLAWFGMGPTPIRSRKAETALIGADPASLNLADIADLAVSDTEPFDDAHAGADYRRGVGRRIFARTLREALDIRQAA